LGAHLNPGGPPQDQPGYYPPLLNGMRGSHPGSFEVLHALRDGSTAVTPVDTGERYDLVVVGAGLSGLAAAHFFRAVRPDARVLLLDNHDDFGGHARRNEFAGHGRVRLMNGGTFSIESPRPYGAVAKELMRTLGIDIDVLSKTVAHDEVYERLGLDHGVFFDRESFGRDRLVAGTGKRKTSDWVTETPLSAQARLDLERLHDPPTDWLPGLTSVEKKDRLSRLSYQAFLVDLVKADPAVVAFMAAQTHTLWGAGIDAVSALDCWGSGLPGFDAMKLTPGAHPRMGFTPAGYADTGGSPVVHFPDGNATIARLLVRALVPSSLPGRSVADSISARLDYSRLDRPGAPVRLRLSAPVVNVRHVGDVASAREVEIAWQRFGRTQSARAGAVILACYGMMVPHLCPQLPASQRAGLHAAVKTPLVYVSVAVRSWRAFANLGVRSVYAPNSYFTSFSLNPTVDIGTYVSPRSPDEPTVIHMERTPCRPGLPELEQHKAGRAELLATPFETFEYRIRDLLTRALGTGGFKPADDIEAITVNRWPHGYAPEYNSLWDSEADLAASMATRESWRKRFGRIAIANSDVGGGAYTDVAIEQGYRAVQELLSA
jgi:spermidine dehydrogenase